MFDPIPLVVKFIRTFEAPLDFRFWLKLVEEEVAELQASLQNNDKLNALKEVADVLYTTIGAAAVAAEDVEQLIGAADLERTEKLRDAAIAAITLSQAKFGFTEDQIEEAFKRVHESNMSKLGENGEVLRREDGKVLKGPNYREPDLRDLVV